jgi:hypothetical protein
MRACDVRISLSGFWRVLVLLICIIGLGSGFALAKTSKTPPPSPPVEKTKFGQPMIFTVLRLDSLACEPNCPEWIQAEGEITDQSPAKLKKLLTNKDYRKLPILLNSPGGRVEAAMEMGRLIRKYGMNTAVAWSNIKGCISTSHDCLPDGKESTTPHLGYAFASGAYCNSACPLMLMGGVVRVAGLGVYVGLHQPIATEKWTDYYRDTWRMVKGKKVIISRRFIKRVVKAAHIVGVMPESKSKYLRYFKEMGGTPAILDEMAKASPDQMNNIPQSGGLRQQLGLVSTNDLDFSSLVSIDHCKISDKLSSNCVYRKDGLPQPPRQTAAPCFILGGCGATKKQETGAKGVPCFSATGCGDADKIATQEWFRNHGALTAQEPTSKAVPCFIESGCGPTKKQASGVKGVPCFTATGCSDADKIATQEYLKNQKDPKKQLPAATSDSCFIASGCGTANKSAAGKSTRNDEAEMSFRVMRLYSYHCEPRCPQWIAAQGWIAKDTAKKFEIFLASTGVRNLPVLLQSHGGDYSAAIELGQIIHRNNLDTAVGATSILGCPREMSMSPCKSEGGVASSGLASAVGAYCERACAVALLAGAVRIVDSGSRVGVEPLSPDDRIPVQEYLAALKQPFSIIGEMDAANLSGGFNSIADWGGRKRTGLISTFGLDLDYLIGDKLCKTYVGFSDNCVDLRTAKKP